MNLLVVHDPWRSHPLTWIHRGEARRIARELRRAGHLVRHCAFDDAERDDGVDRRILRLSDPLMFRATEALSLQRRAYVGPGFEAMKRCYDKFSASRRVEAAGIACPQTELATEADRIGFPLVLKPRWGSDSIGLRSYTRNPLPARKRNERHIVQRRIRGIEITIAVLHGNAGAPLHIELPSGALYTFARKYFMRPRIQPLRDQRLAQRIAAEALRIGETLAVDWAARIDLIYETATDVLYFLECDVAPLVGPGSAFDTSMRAAGMTRDEQLERLFC